MSRQVGSLRMKMIGRFAALTVALTMAAKSLASFTSRSVFTLEIEVLSTADAITESNESVRLEPADVESELCAVVSSAAGPLSVWSGDCEVDGPDAVDKVEDRSAHGWTASAWAGCAALAAATDVATASASPIFNSSSSLSSSAADNSIVATRISSSKSSSASVPRALR
eukprot:scaffold19295_cov112-Isochrysis_galbana.AAC.4